MRKFQVLLLSSVAAGAILLAAFFTHATSTDWQLASRSPQTQGKGLRVDVKAREKSLISMHGFDIGAPRDAYANAVKQARAMRDAERIVRGALGPQPNQLAVWQFIGPLPMRKQRSNFGGAVFGPRFNATGRITALAVETAGNIYVGAAGGGEWLSRDSGATFTSMGDNGKLPTQPIGAISIDSFNHNPPRVYVGALPTRCQHIWLKALREGLTSPGEAVSNVIGWIGYTKCIHRKRSPASG